VPKPEPLPAPELAELERNAGADFEAEEAAHREQAAPVFADGPAESGSQAPFLRPGIPAMSVVMIAGELAPVAKIGGLADVVFGLSRELELRGHAVEIVLPKYDCLRWQHIHGLTPAYQDLWVPWYGGAIHTTVYSGSVLGRKCFFLEPHSADRFFDRGKVYGDRDDVMRFAFFSRAALEFLFKTGKHPDIIHCHDWQTALVPVLLYEIYQHLGMRHPRVCFTIHNFKHQGQCGNPVLRATGLNRPEYFSHRDRLGGGAPGALNLLKGGIVYSNYVNTVSPTYAGEAKDRGGAFGLEATLRTHQGKYGGILNGIDYEVFNPERDEHLPAHYSAATVERKYDDKRALRQRLLLAENAKPIVAYIGRLDAQKGLDLVRHAIFYCINHGAQFVLLGSGAEPGIDRHFRHIKQEINENPDSHLEIGYNEELAPLIYAGADLLIVPSRFEPCGLTQLIAMRYGTIPVVRAVGGLADTVFDKDYSDKPLHERNGYVFHHDDIKGLESALSRAIACYYMYPDHFRQLMLNAMRCDYSWNVPGQHYLNVYDFIRDK
jgi:starch synthase